MIVWIASYPRSGNSYARALIKFGFEADSMSVYGDQSDIGASKMLIRAVGHTGGRLAPEQIEEYREGDDLHFIKTHDRPEVHFRDGDKYIYLLRDGRDVVVSFYHYLKDFAPNSDATMEDVIAGNVVFGAWSVHVDQWAEVATDSKLVIRFEELIRRPVATMRQIGKLIGRSPRKGRGPGFSELHAINAKFFRSGKVGSWANELTDDQHSLFWAVNGETMRRSGYDIQPPDLSQSGRADSLVTEVSSRMRQAAERQAALSKTRILGLSDSVERLTGQLSRQQNAHQTLTAQHATLKQELKQSADARTETFTRFEKLAWDYASLTERFGNAKSEQLDQLDQTRRLTAERDALQERLSALQSVQAEERGKLDQLTATYASSEERLTELQAAYDIEVEFAQNLVDELQAAHAQEIDRLIARHRSLEQSIASLQTRQNEEIAEWREQTTQLQADLTGAKSRQEELLTQLRDSQAGERRTSIKYERLMEQMTDLLEGRQFALGNALTSGNLPGVLAALGKRPASGSRKAGSSGETVNRAKLEAGVLAAEGRVMEAPVTPGARLSLSVSLSPGGPEDAAVLATVTYLTADGEPVVGPFPGLTMASAYEGGARLSCQPDDANERSGSISLSVPEEAQMLRLRLASSSPKNELLLTRATVESKQ